MYGEHGFFLGNTEYLNKKYSSRCMQKQDEYLNCLFEKAIIIKDLVKFIVCDDALQPVPDFAPGYVQTPEPVFARGLFCFSDNLYAPEEVSFGCIFRQPFGLSTHNVRAAGGTGSGRNACA